jgi:hypothetical protein
MSLVEIVPGISSHTEEIIAKESTSKGGYRFSIVFAILIEAKRERGGEEEKEFV